ncbi:MAG: hypothetical protein QS748_07110 [Candidatus Endonucleobacter bathymodioli]|uniref:Uncharacterized protein n=1 Tax=Candidatus Endonucleibacter bathymodioli TaxID=539814 RepID=A0AA90SSY9_9GAMM|nr:hypothetical protein [Candidatus Endonucleobacter bathymodioli]
MITVGVALTYEMFASDKDADGNKEEAGVMRGLRGLENWRFGNCDSFNAVVCEELRKIGYNDGGYGSILIESKEDDGTGHHLNYITLDDEVIVIDAWTNTHYNLKDIETFLPNNWAKNKPYLFSFGPKKNCDVDIVSRMTNKVSIRDAMDAIDLHYDKRKPRFLQ